MLNGLSLAEVLGWLGIVLVPATAIWGLLGAKPTRETETGRKLLTRGGYITIALINCAAGLSAWSFYRNGVANTEEAAKQTVRDAQLGRADAQSKAASANSQLAKANSAATFAAQVAEQARADARASAQMAQSLAAAAEARSGERRLASRVNAESARNLGRTSEALTQLERLLQPLEPIFVFATWEIDPTAPQMRAATARMRALMAAEARKTGRVPEEMTFLRGTDVFLGDIEAERPLGALLHVNAGISFFADPGEAARIASVADGGYLLLREGDLVLPMSMSVERVTLIAATGAVRFETQATVELIDMNQNGKIVSWPDLERASALAQIVRNFRPAPLYAEVRLVDLHLRGSKRKYHVSGGQLRTVSRNKYHVVHALPPLEPLRERAN